MPTRLTHLWLLPLVSLWAFAPLIRAQPAAGVIEGRVMNVTSGAFLHNARVSIPGTRCETFTDESGDYRLTGVPAGKVQVVAVFTGLQPQAATLTIVSGQAAKHDFNLTRAGVPERAADDPVKLDQFVVAANREMNASDIAAQEQRYAPNIKNVVDADAFGDAGEGNLGEFLKFVPGITINYSSFDARTISVRGLPSSTTPVMVDGNRIASAASSGVTREVEVGGLIMNNIARVEVSKTPTPDTPADSMGGAVNVVSKGAFDRRTPLFSYHLNAVMNSEWITLKKMPGAQPETTGRRVLPGADFSYIAPVSKTFGFTLNGFYSQRYSGTQMSQPIWRPANGTSTFGTATNPFLNGHTLRDQPTFWERLSIGTTADWKVGAQGMLTLGTQFTTTDVHQLIEIWTTSITGTSSTRPLGYDPTFVQSAPGAGSAVIDTDARRKTDRTWHSNVKYRHNGLVWKLDGGASYSRSTNTYRDIDNGFFNSALSRVRNLSLRYGEINSVREGPGSITATSTAGAPIDLYSLASYSLQTVDSNQRTSADVVKGAHANARRDFNLGLPFTLRAGADVRQNDRDIRTEAPSWTFIGPDHVANTADDFVSRYDVIDTVYSAGNAPFHLPHLQHPSPYKMWQLYQAHPDYFRLDEAGAINTSTAASRKLTETIAAGYLRGDLRLFQRLLLVGGARYERTGDDGFGRLNDLRATYQQDASGNLIRDAAGRPIRRTTDAVALARLQFIDRGAHASRTYDNLYPSFNATYHLTTNLQARAAYARTIGRPNLNEIIPSITVTDPTAAETNRTITVVNTGLKPWTAENYDLSLEYYFEKSGRVSLSVFRKDITNFFGTTRTPATVELLAQYELSDDYLGYDVITKNNIGDARVSGIDFDYQQPLAFLPKWASGTLAFFNVTKTHLEGNAIADFSGFTRESTNWGLSVTRPRYNLKLVWNWRGKQRLAAVTGAGIPPGTYTYMPDYLTLNVNAEYRFTRRVGAYVVIRNIANRPLITEIYGPGTPRYARVSNYQNLGSQISLGLKGEF